MFVPMKCMLEDARREGYGVMAMNVCNLEMARGAVTAAENTRAPLILQISPKQMRRHAHAAEMIPLIRGLAERASVPVCLNFDHGMAMDDLLDAIRGGFTNVMFDGSSLPLEENIRRTRLVCALAHGVGVTVEAELGHVGKAEDEDDLNTSFLTDPETARDFVAQTGVDALAVAIGTAHGAYPKGKQPVLDFERLDAVFAAVPVPLVLHGGSGSGEANLREAVRRGVSKINVATDAFQTAKDGFLNAAAADPKADYFTLSAAAENAVRDMAETLIRVMGSAGRVSFGA